MVDLSEPLGGVMCGVCGVGLTKITKRDFGEEYPTSGWAHAGEVFNTTDHVAVPVPYDENFLVSVCDFCNESVPLDQRNYLPVADFDIGLQLDHPDGRQEFQLYQNRGGYGCCNICAEFVRTNAWAALTARYLRLHDTALMGPLEIIWAETRKHITGPVRPWQAGDHLVED